MNNRSSGTRSFNTVKRSNREERLKRRRRCGLTLIAIVVVFLLLVASTLGLLIGNLVVAIRNGRTDPGGENDTPDQPALPGISYQLSTEKTEDYLTGELIVVNNSHRYQFPTVEMKDLSAYRQTVDGKEPYQIRLGTKANLQEIAAVQLNALLTDYYRQTGISLVVYDTYRSQSQQEDGGYSVKAGFSEHHTGLLISLSQSHTGYNLNEEENELLFRMCHEYGFIQRYPAGKSGLTGVGNYGECLRYVGVAHATYIYKNGLCVEEYVELLRKNHVSLQGTDGKHLSVDTDQNGVADYAVYYVPKGDTSVTTLYTPVGLPFTVSGDNAGGFIVTVSLHP